MTGDQTTLTRAELKELRRLAGMAHERELSETLGELEAAFAAWRREEIDAFELAHKIHEFDHGRARDLNGFYSHARHEWAVAHALTQGVITSTDVSVPLMEKLAELVVISESLEQD